MEVAQHKTVNRTAPVPAAAAHSQAGKPQTGAGSHERFPSPSTKRFAESGILGKSEVARYLAMKGEPVRMRGTDKLRKLSENEQRHDSSSEKLNQTETAVVIPLSEEQSKSNAGQIEQVDNRKAPAPAENKVKQQLQTSLAENIPQTIEEVDNFKSDNKAGKMSNAVMSVVQGDKNDVVSTFSEMEETPQPAPTEKISTPLPAEEKEPVTPEMNLGQGAIAPLQPQHIDVSNYTKEADAKLKEEGITQEQLDMVDSGDLATANKEKKGMEKMAKTEPQSIQNFASQEAEKVNSDLKGEEKKERNALKSRRKADLSATSMKQKNTKNALEKKREEVAKQINAMYSTAQKSVVKKLSDLETKSMKSFDDGSNAATSLFEDQVKREMDAYKSERYKGLRGKYRKAKDWLLGMKDLPEVKAIFDRSRAIFVASINKLITTITAANKSVISECKLVLANAKKEIAVYVSKLGPGLKDIGKKAAEEMNGKLAGLDSFIGQKEQELQQKLAQKQEAAIKAIDDKIEKMKEAMSGALAKIGNLLLLAAKKFFTWALKQAGYTMAVIEGVLNKGASVLKSIFTQPIQFAKNVIHAAITGFKNFGINFLKHLKNSLFEWLTGTLEGLVLPQVWDLKGIVGLALQMIGITYQNIRRHMVNVMGETVVSSVEKSFALVKTLITEGPMAAWEQLKEMAGEMQQAFIEAVKDFLKVKIIEQAIQWVVSLFVPGAGIVKAIIAIYDTIMFFVQKAKQIIQMVGSFLSSVGEIAAGNIGAAADALENGLARGLTVVISFLAQLLHLNGITNKIKGVIQKIRSKVDNVIDKVVKWIADKAKMLVGKAKDAAGKVVDWWKARKPFKTAAGESHEIYYSGTEKDAVAMVASKDPKPVKKKLNELRNSSTAGSAEEENKGKSLIAKAEAALAKDPNDPNLVVYMKEIIEIFEEGNAGKEMKITRKTGSLGGDTVGLEMSVDWLGAGPHHGSPPQSGVQDKLMGLLVTDPGKSSDEKFIRGHLLNEHLGGEGVGNNMFPITGNANSKHLHSTEKEVKKWITKPKRWVKYDVKVQGISSRLNGGPKNPVNFVNSSFVCHAILKDAAGKTEEEFSTVISSVYQERPDVLTTKKEPT
ncbi:MAG: hypothetical protein WCI31_10065 [Prolixibacteraceae bacterium]